MADEPFKKILDREFYSALVEDYFCDSIKLVDEFVDYGTVLLPRCFEFSDKKLKDIVIIVSLAKQAITLLDSLSILSRKGSTIPCALPLRSLFEIKVYLDWILQKETEKRALSYYVWGVRNHLYWTLCCKEGTPEHKAHQEHIKDTPSLKSNFASEKEIDAEIDILKVKLSTEKCKPINDLFEEYNRNKKKKKDKDWYSPLGISSIRHMASEVKMEAYYKIVYSYYSKLTHGVTFDQNVNFKNAEVIFEPIRNLTGMDQILTFSLSFSFYIYRSLLNYYRPSELPSFAKKYVEEWRDRFLTICKVEQTKEGYNLSKKTNSRK